MNAPPPILQTKKLRLGKNVLQLRRSRSRLESRALLDTDSTLPTIALCGQAGKSKAEKHKPFWSESQCVCLPWHERPSSFPLIVFFILDLGRVKGFWKDDQ